MNPEQNLESMGIRLPVPTAPKGTYVSCRRTGNLVFVSGQGPAVAGKPRYKGRLGAELSVEEGYQSARICGINALAQLKAFLGSLERIKKIVSVHGYVSSAPDFYLQAEVINGASDLLAAAFGADRGSHSRCALGAIVLPGNIATEVEVVVEVMEEADGEESEEDGRK